MTRCPVSAAVAAVFVAWLTAACSDEGSNDGTTSNREREEEPSSEPDSAASSADDRTQARSDPSKPLLDAALGSGTRPDASVDGRGSGTNRPDADTASSARSDASSVVATRPRDPSPHAPPVNVTGPIAGTPSTLPPPTDFGEAGYVEEEFFFEGNATAYTLQGERTMDGKWNAIASSKAGYKSRFLVRRPKDATRFNGTIVVEWLNVSGGIDVDPGFRYIWEEVLREGYVWVGVSAQQVGVEGGSLFSLITPFLVPDPPMALKVQDPERYGTLLHPGDAYSYDLFTQVAQVIRDPGGVDVLNGLVPQRLIAYGESQSAGRLITYANAVQPLVKEYDGIFIHSGAFSATLNDSLSWDDSPVFLRQDLEQPVMKFMTETDVFQIGRPVEQPDNDHLRTWEVAGTSHADSRVLPAGFDLGCGMMNDGPQHFVVKAALHALDLWIRDGTLPAHGELLMRDSNDVPLFDEHGIMRGGIRTPDVDVPIATYKGVSDSGDPLCGIFGETIPFSPEELKQLYPTHEDYVTKVAASARAAREAGFLLPAEEHAFVSEAEAAPVPP